MFDMFSNIKREKFQHHIYTDMQVPLLKQAAIYGANGSGKSNFIKAIIFLREFITHENFLKTVDLDDYIFQLTQDKNQTLLFEVEFYHGDTYYMYAVEIDKNDISEKLSIAGLNVMDDTLIFERKGSTIHSPCLQNENSAKQLLSLNPQSSLLPLNLKFPVLSGTDARNAYDWFSEQLRIISINSTVPMLINLMSQKPAILNFANHVFDSIGIGIKAVNIKNTSFEKWATHSKNADELQQIIEKNPLQPDNSITQWQGGRCVLNMTIQKGIKTIQEFMFDQLGESGYHKEMKISAQSDGTFRLLTLIPALYEVMYERKTVFVDEIDNSIHPNLMFELLRFYANNKANGQLIFTTHTTKLLNQQELVRPDEVWLTEKSEGNTRLYSLNDFKLHNTLNLENGYLDGRYGAVPIMGDLNCEEV
jgi:AAA15 family ATPase/GTPase